MLSPRSFMAGFLTLGLLHLFVTCSRDDSAVNPGPQDNVNVESIHKGAKNVEDAFRTADPDRVSAILTDEAQLIYDGDLEQYRTSMAEFADAITTRQLTAYSALYAEFQYTAGTRTLSFALAAQDDGDWKLMRF